MDPTTTTVADDVASSPPYDPPMEEEEEEEENIEQPLDDNKKTKQHTLTDDLSLKIIKQVEYYFSDENLPTDKFMMKHVSKNVDGFVPIGVIASFRKMKRLTHEKSFIVEALKQSSFLVLSPNGKKVRRLHPISSEVKDPMLRTVLVENLPEDHSSENIRRIFGAAGITKNICIRDPQAVAEPTKRTIAEKMLSGKLHALVEYGTVEAAEKAVALLNNQQDWRFGMRVKLLKHAEKNGGKKKAWRDTDSQKNHNVEASYEETHSLSEHQDDTHDEEKHEGDQKEKNGQKPQNRRHGNGKGQKYHVTNGHGHGTLSSSYGSEFMKPPPGPKMPDGTKGFVMGRGRPLASSPS